MLWILCGLLIIHFLCDFGAWSMNDELLAAKSIGSPLYPIFDHAYGHATAMLIFLTLFSPTIYGLILAAAILQLISHFVIDVLKGKLCVWCPITADKTQKPYWFVLGLDQLLHQLVIIVMIAICF